VTETTEQPVSTTTAARSRRGDGLSGMVLADLKALAAQLGIKGTSGLRKGDLVSAIASHQNAASTNGGPAASPAQTNGAAAHPNGDSDHRNGGTADQTLSLDLDLPQRQGRRRSAGRPEGAPIPAEAVAPPATSGTGTTDTTRTDTAPGQTADGSTALPDSGAAERQSDSRSATNGGTSTQVTGDRQDRPSYDGDEGPRTSRRNRRNRRDRDNRGTDASGDGQSANESGTRDGQAQGGQGQNRDGQNRDGQNRDGQSRDGQSRDGQVNRTANRDGRQDGNRQDGNRQDGEDTDGRRGRRFRDRNRRSRDRFADAPVDTEVRDDDVLVPVAGIVDVLDSYAFIRTS